jgi:hypothetical protein
MFVKDKKFGIFITFVNLTVIAIAVLYVYKYRSGTLPESLTISKGKVLGSIESIVGTSVPKIPPLVPVVSATPTPIPSITLTPTITPTPTPPVYTVSFVNTPAELTEGNFATFTWSVSGEPITIHTASVYIGQKSTPGELSEKIGPQNTSYSDKVKDFLDGNYNIPIQFIGNIQLFTPGTYYYRGYAFLDGRHFWSDEKTLQVHRLPNDEIKMLDFKSNFKAGENTVFTWEITGPANDTSYTAIVASKQSKSGVLDDTLALSDSVYTMVVVKDFTASTIHVPLRFIGNGVVGDTGTYYFRAYALINGKHIWSDENSFTVE